MAGEYGIRSHKWGNCFAPIMVSTISSIASMSQEARQLQSSSHGLLNRLKRARRFVQWWPLATAPAALILHIEIELNFVSYWPSPQEHSPFLIGFGFRMLVWATLLLAVFI